MIEGYKKLGPKKRISNDSWVNTFKNIDKIISFEEVKAKADSTMIEMYWRTGKKNVGYGYSGGKDSIVLSHLLKQLGLNNGVFIIDNLQYPDFLKWLKTNKPKEVEVINTGVDLPWLVNNQELLFPSPKIRSTSYKGKYKLQQKYYDENNLDIFMTGRRSIDGNRCFNKESIYTNKKGMTVYNPIQSWSHEEILGYIYYFRLNLPPCYEWKNGFVEGTHSWNMRSYQASTSEAWEDIWHIDKTIIYEASNYFASAKDILNKLENGGN